MSAWWVHLHYSAAGAVLIVVLGAALALAKGVKRSLRRRRRRLYRNLPRPIADSRSSVDLFNWFTRGGR